jgi:competence ComEA-like helix-hairpin-helix protein
MKQRKKASTFCVIFFGVFALFLCGNGSGICQGWTDLTRRLLPDSSFAIVESGEAGKKLRHCPHHDLNGNLDEEQLIYVLGTLERETWLDLKNSNAAKKHLKNHYDKFIAKIMKKGLQGTVDINRAGLTELVILPNIGPVIAVKIVEYRNMYGLFESIEDIKKVEGIGSGTFNSVRHYISTH